VHVLAATNYPWLIDEAALRHLGTKIYVGLPDGSSRFNIFIHFLRKFEGLEYDSTPENKQDFRMLTENYSGADLSLLASEAAEFHWEKAKADTHFVCYVGWSPAAKKIIRGMWKPCSQNGDGATRRKMDEIPPDVLFLLVITMKDVRVVLKFVKLCIQTNDGNPSEHANRKLKSSELYVKLNSFKVQISRKMGSLDENEDHEKALTRVVD
jgi:SpoVK/Ycf46/Vps4 family AAA+-type ATPase